MKKIGRILAIIFLVVPMVIGAMFLSPNLTHNATQTAQNGGGGGANSLNSPETGDNSAFEGGDKDPKNAGSDTTWTEPIYKTYQDYFVDYFNLPSEVYSVEEGIVTIDYSQIKRTKNGEEISLSYNGNVFDTITAGDVYGLGTPTNPYVVGSTKGFLFLLNTSLSGLASNAKTINIVEDIVLNDEKFLEDGTPIGGDGVVYSWYANFYLHSTTFYGNNNTISGLYYNDANAENVSLFGYNKLSLISDLKMENVYMRGYKFVTTLASNILKAENITILSGTITSVSTYSSSVSYQVGEANNITNYANVVSTNSSACGLFNIMHSNGVLTNCTNYGNVNSKGWVSAGIVGDCLGNIKIINCKNFGRIYNSSIHCAGIFGISYQKKCFVFISGCENFGLIEISSQDYGPAGIIGYVEANLTLYKCKNYGQLKGGYCSELIALVVHETANIKETNVVLEKCQVDSINSAPLIQFITSKYCVDIKMVGCVVNQKRSDQKEFYITNQIPATNCSVNIKDCSFLVGKNITTIKICRNADFLKGKLQIENLMLDATESYNNIKYELFEQLNYCSNYEINGLVISMATSGVFYGSDFSGYYVDFKTGKIGLKSLSGKGFFQGEVTKDTLLAKGYTEKSV